MYRFIFKSINNDGFVLIRIRNLVKNHKIRIYKLVSNFYFQVRILVLNFQIRIRKNPYFRVRSESVF